MNGECKHLLLESYYDILMAKALLDKSKIVIGDECKACLVEQANRKHSECVISILLNIDEKRIRRQCRRNSLMMEQKLLYVFFDSILACVDKNQVLLDWRKEVSQIVETPEAIDLFQKRLEECFVKHQMAKWKTKMIDYICEITI